jgi:acetyl/propionyl-CoA carboxylase alpha subunit
MPAIGTITGLHLPSCRHVRVDTALFKGYEVTLHYEPLLAKVMAWGQTRDEAVKRLHKALLAFRLEGVRCNVPLLRDILTSNDFAQATHHTGSLPVLVEARKQRQLHPGVNGHMNGNGHEKANREVAAAIGAALALAMPGSPTSGSATSVTDPWRVYGRREQLLSRTLGNRGWR